MAIVTNVTSYDWVHGSTGDAVIETSQPDTLTSVDAVLVIVGSSNLSGWCGVVEC